MVKLMKKARQMGVKGSIKETPKRTRSMKLKERKQSQGIVCFFSSDPQPLYFDSYISSINVDY